MISGRTRQLAACLILSALAVSAGPACAETSGKETPPAVPESGPPSAKKADPAVIHPGDPDPGMAVKPPRAGTMPVVPPPGTPGGNPTVIPK